MTSASPAFTPESLTAEGQQRFHRADELLLALHADRGPSTREGVLEPLNALLLELTNVATQASLLSEVHPDPAVREAAEALEREAQQRETAVMQDRAVYDALRSVSAEALAGDPQALRNQALLVQDMRREGVELSDAERERARELHEEIVRLEQDFARNIRDDVRYVDLTGPDELAGLPEDYVRAHVMEAERTGGPIRISTDYPDSIPFMAYARSESARRALSFENLNRASPANLDVLRRLLQARYELARLLGYPHWAAYVTETKMVGSAEAAWSFVQQARAAAEPSGRAELAELLRLKSAEQGVPAPEIGSWELSYYLEQAKTARFQFDPREVRPYFEYRAVKEAVLALNSQLFDLTITPAEGVMVWHPSVETFDVALAGRHIGRFSLDMHPREGKYKHAACFTWKMGVAGMQEPHCVLVCNFPDPATSDGPALMEHREVVTFFHEFGHLVHQLVRGAIPWVRLGPVTEWDFVEAPSQFLEEWTYDEEVLRRFARHVETGEPIPAALVDRLRAARDFGRGLHVLRQLFFSAVSLAFHDRDPEDLDTTATVFELAREYAPFRQLPDTHMEASFGHLGGYSAVYYTYMWSLVIAKDLHSAFTNGLLDLTQTRRYRDAILAPGGSQPAAELVAAFLGRPYNFEAFARWLAPDPSQSETTASATPA